MSADSESITEEAVDSSTASAPPADPALLVAHYMGERTPPRVYRMPGDDLGAVLRATADFIEEHIQSTGSRMPILAVRELIDNLSHAGTAGAVVSLLDGGDTLRVSDRGPGIRDKERALLPGFTTSNVSLREVIRGVGSGLGLAAATLEALGGSLEIDDNLGGGSVVTARVPRTAETTRFSPKGALGPTISERQLRALLLIVELGPVGPTAIARELGISASTSYRDLVTLQEAGYVDAGSNGHRLATDEGLAYVQAVL
ncbi:MAG: helix-turn-helix domain-containing protein [Actinobacteria bacterium]|nr:helix-turn-helix domain-containing protein [Actinomycetota bacterium]